MAWACMCRAWFGCAAPRNLLSPECMLLKLDATHATLAALASTRAVRLPGLLAPSVADTLAERVLAARPAWASAFGGEQHSLGLAWYTHFETGKERHYFRDALASDAQVERILPGMQAGVREVIAAFVGAPVLPRPGFCGPGVQIFLADSPVARNGGVVHFDLEGLRTTAERKQRALSFVLMLQPPLRGGGLRLWPALYAGRLHPTNLQRAEAAEVMAYSAGDAVFFASQRLHQIEGFAGGCARITITAHALQRPDSTWLSWF
jgi:hypothetical protein